MPRVGGESFPSLLKAAQFTLRNTFSMIPAGIGRTILESDLPSKVT
jgi:hypothetical protein